MNEGKMQRRIFGLDIHPSCFSAAAFLDDNSHITKQKPLFLQDKIPMENFDRWLIKNTETGDLLVMEALGQSFDLARRIEATGRTAIVLESGKAGKVGKSYLKDDKVDAIKCAKIHLSGLGEPVWIPDAKTIERREILFGYLNAVKDSTRSANRIWGFLTQNGIVVKAHQKKKYKKDPEWLLSMREWTPAQRIIIGSYIEDFQTANKKRKAYESYMAVEVSTCDEMMKLQQFYGIRVISAFALIAIIGDISRFKTPKKLVAYIGLQPKVMDSGASTFTGSISKNGRKELKALLMECSKAMIQYAPADHAIAKWARKLKYHKKGNVVTVAAARKLVTAIWYVLNGYSSPLTEISDMIKCKLGKIGRYIGEERRKELGFGTVAKFISVKGTLFLSDSA